MKTFKLSLHSHTTNFIHFILTKPNKKKYLEKLLKILFKKKGNLVLGITNFNDDNRYKKLLETTKLLSKKYIISKEHKDYFFSIKLNKKEIHFIKTDEIETNKGHILIIGFKGKIRKRRLDNVLKEAHRKHCIIIANHPLHDFGLSYFLIKKILRKPESMSITKKEIEENKKYFDALELSSYFPEDWKKIKAFAKKNKKTLISDSDAHFLDEIFTSWYEVKGLNFNNPLSFKKSLKKALRKNLHLHARKHNYFARYKHSLEVVLEKIGKSVGLIKT